MKRTGEATMVSVYGSRADAEKLISRVRKMHDRVTGVTPGGVAYAANDPELLDWVHVTASYGFLEAYNAYVRPVSVAEKDEFYSAGIQVASLYGALGAPRSEAERKEQFIKMHPLLEPSPIVFEFIDIIENTRILPFPLRSLQETVIRASIDILPREVRDRLDLGPHFDLGARERSLLGRLGRLTDRLPAPRPSSRGSKRRRAFSQTV